MVGAAVQSVDFDSIRSLSHAHDIKNSVTVSLRNAWQARDGVEKKLANSLVVSFGTLCGKQAMESKSRSVAVAHSDKRLANRT